MATKKLQVLTNLCPSDDAIKSTVEAYYSKHPTLIDKVTPAFSETASVVTCEPVEGYPLSVISHIPPDPNLLNENFRSVSSWNLDTSTGGSEIRVCEIGTFEAGDYCFIGNTSFSLELNYRPNAAYAWTDFYLTYGNGEFKKTVTVPDAYGPTQQLALVIYDTETPLSEILEGIEFIRLEKGTGASNRPVDGYSSVNLWRGGKNLFDTSKIHSAVCTFNEATGLWTTIAPGNSAGYHRSLFTNENGQNGSRDISKLIRVPSNRKITVTLNDWSIEKINFTDDDVYMVPTFMGYAFYDGNGNWVTGDSAFDSECLTLTTPNVDPCYLDIRRCTGEVAVSFSSIQIEIGSTATTYEPYRGETLTVDLGEAVNNATFDWTTGVLTREDGTTKQLTPQEILALPGVNTFYSDTGDTEVTGRADPIALIDKLTNAIVALGGNV